MSVALAEPLDVITTASTGPKTTTARAEASRAKEQEWMAPEQS